MALLSSLLDMRGVLAGLQLLAIQWKGSRGTPT